MRYSHLVLAFLAVFLIAGCGSGTNVDPVSLVGLETEELQGTYVLTDVLVEYQDPNEPDTTLDDMDSFSAIMTLEATSHPDIYDYRVEYVISEDYLTATGEAAFGFNHSVTLTSDDGNVDEARFYWDRPSGVLKLVFTTSEYTETDTWTRSTTDLSSSEPMPTAIN